MGLTLSFYFLALSFLVVFEIISCRAKINSFQFGMQPLRALELKRIDLLYTKLFYWLSFLTIPLCLFFLPDYIPLVILIYFLYSIYIYRIIQEKKHFINDWFKNSIVVKEFSKTFDNVYFDPYSSFSDKEILDLFLFYDSNVLYGSNLLIAEKLGKSFSCCSLKAYNRLAYSSSDKILDDRFIGTAFKFANLSDINEVLIASKGFPNSQNLFMHYNKVNCNDSIQTETALFNYFFDTFSKSEVDEIALFTPYLIDKVISLKEVVVDKFAILFKDSYIYVFVQSAENDRLSLQLNDTSPIDDQYNKIKDFIKYLSRVVANIPFLHDNK